MALDEIAHYRVINKLGEGGMGEVYLAEDTRLDRRVALKLLPEKFTRDEDRVRRFVQEAKAASALNHPNIITIYEIGQTDNKHYIATEFIEGETLRDKLSRGPLSANETLDVAIQVASALAAAHKAGVIHRDIKPENVMAREDGIVKVLDFGLAKLTERRSGAVSSEAPTIARVNTDPGMVMGTIGYMAPEQARGREVDVRTDVFSLGVILYEMLTGRAPFAGETPSDVIAALLEREPAPIARLAPDAPADLRHIVNKALRKDREERYESVKSMLADLKALKQELEFAAGLERSSSPELTSASRRASSVAASILPEAEESDGLDLAHVLFCDIVGYSLLPIDQQTQMMRQLQEIVRQTEDYRRAEASHQLVRLPAGDGMALAFLQDPAAPVRCAMEIARVLKSHPDIRLRMGVNTGPVFRSADINANRNVVGSGINLAQRVMDCGDAGHILVSRSVAEVLGHVSRWQPLLHDLGEVEVKHGVRIHLYNIYNDEVGNAETPAKLRDKTSAAPQTSSSAKIILGEVNRHKLGVLLTLILLLLVTVGGYFVFSGRRRSGSIESLAVMPFVNASGNAEAEYLSDGMTETLIKSLSQLPNLSVKARSSVFRYKGKETDAKTIGKELNVEAILNGRVVQRGEQLTLNLELIDAQTENVIWTDQYDRKSSDLVSLQNVIARDVSSKLKIQLSGADLEKLAKNYTNDPEAYRLYLQGRFYWNKRVGKEFERAEGYFQQAVARDPKFALGYIGLADFKEDNDRPRKKEYIRRALEIDDRLAEAHASLGYQYMMDYNWAESERELKRAIELNPNYPQAHQWNGMRLMMNGKFDEARPELTRALELDPTSLGINLYYGVLLEVSGRTDECILQSKKLIEMEPTYSWAYIQLARVYRLKGDHQASVEAIARNSELIGNEVRAKALRESFAKGGWQAYVQEQAKSPPMIAASFLAELGEHEKAIEAILKQAETPGKFWFFLHRTDPFLDPIRNDPRFKEAMKKLDPPQ
ncbi:MAG: protein kinase [Blastocatellales bacterium]